jgi:Predicted AAA-ATPase
MVFQDRSHLRFPADAGFENFFSEPGAIVVDKTHFIPLLEESDFQYMFLRPRRWGKSTFLSMLAAYYDVKTKDSFEEIFGELEIGKAPTESRNSHLILLFDFSNITGRSRKEIKRSVFANISGSLREFLRKYGDILGDPLPEEYIIPDCTAASLRNVLVSWELVFTTALNVIGSDLPKWLYCFRWCRRVRYPGQFLFMGCLELPNVFAGDKGSNRVAGSPFRIRILRRNEAILWQICCKVLAYWSASGFP